MKSKIHQNEAEKAKLEKINVNSISKNSDDYITSKNDYKNKNVSNNIFHSPNLSIIGIAEKNKHFLP